MTATEKLKRQNAAMHAMIGLAKCIVSKFVRHPQGGIRVKEALYKSWLEACSEPEAWRHYIRKETVARYFKAVSQVRELRASGKREYAEMADAWEDTLTELEKEILKQLAETE